MSNEGVPIPDITEFAPPTKLGSDEIVPLIINLIETYKHNDSTFINKHSALISATIKNATVTDSVRGLELDLEHIAEILGTMVIGG
jgi:hypothetical protein